MPIRWARKITARRAQHSLNNLLVVRGIKFPHVGTINHKNLPLLSGTDAFIRMYPGLTRQEQHPTRCEVQVVGAQVCLVVGSEVVSQDEFAIEKIDPQQTIPKIDSSHMCVKIAVPSLEKNISLGVRSGRGTGLPDAASRSIGRVIVHCDLRECRRIIPEQPAMIGIDVPMSRKTDIDHSAQEQQTSALNLAVRIEDYMPVIIVSRSPARKNGFNPTRATRFFGSTPDVERVKPEDIFGNVFPRVHFDGFCDYVKGLGLGTDDG